MNPDNAGQRILKTMDKRKVQTERPQSVDSVALRAVVRLSRIFVGF